MTEKYINVPKEINFISQWTEFEKEIPKGKVLLNKKFPGCGMTTYYLINSEPIILCAPRKLLLKNKQEQMQNGACYHYVLPEKIAKLKPGELTPVQKNHSELIQYLNSCNLTGIPPKILVTYDSLHHVLNAVTGSPFIFKIIVDEAHVIFSDSEMKPNRTESFCQLLSNVYSDVVFISATPDKDDFEKISYFQNLQYCELVWDKSKIQENLIHYIPIRSTLKAACDIIDSFKTTGIFQTKGDKVSTEAVFFLNDVAKICKIIEDCQLGPDEVNIICADRLENLGKIKKKLGAKYIIGKPPKKDQPHVPYTFCSKTAFMGCDFYSTNACTYVFADANLKNMTTDISLDLPQILGRQRLNSNVFRVEATVFVNLNTGKLETEDEYKSYHQSRLETSQKLENQLFGWDTELLNTIDLKEDKSYVVIKENYLTGQKEAVISDIRQTSEKRAWRLRNKVYKDHETVKSLIINSDLSVVPEAEVDARLPEEVVKFCQWFIITKDSRLRMKGYIDFLDEFPTYQVYLMCCSYIPQEYHDFYDSLGPDKIKGYGYQLSRLRGLVSQGEQSDNIKNSISSIFSIGQRLSKEEIKTSLSKIYTDLGVNKTAKATDLLEYYNVKEINIQDKTTLKRVKGYELLSLK